MRILIPTDFSDNAGDALRYTLDSLAGRQATIHVVNVVDPQIATLQTTAMIPDITAQQQDAAQASMKALEAFSRNYLSNDGSKKVELTTNVVLGKASTMIRKEAIQVKSDVIIMGTKGSNHDIIDKLIGTVSSEVVKQAPCPVILIPGGFKFRGYDNVIFGSNLNHSDPYELWRATELMKPHVAILRCLHVSKDKEDLESRSLAKFVKYMTEHSPSVQTKFETEISSDVVGTILAYAENFDADMIIMHHEKKSIWGKIFGKSQTVKMTSMIKIPLMVMNS